MPTFNFEDFKPIGKSSSINYKWPTTAKRFVAFFDILGFKDRIMRSSHIDIYDDLNSINDIFKKIEKEYNDNDTGIYIVNFSDSIAFFSKSDTLLDFNSFVIIVGYAFREILKKKIAIKAAIAHGEISVNKSNRIFFGQPIIDAFLLEEDLNYLGIVCHHTFDQYVKKIKDDLVEVYENILLNRLTPLKYGKITHTNIAWFKIYRDDEKHLEISNEEILSNLEITMSGSPKRYIDNTRDFIKEASS